MDSFPPAHEPARHLDDLLVGLDDEDGDDVTEAVPDLPEVAEAVTGRARDLHRLADRLSADANPGAGTGPGAGTVTGAETGAGAGADGTLSAVALLRAHAGAVDALAEHLLAAGAQHAAAAPETVHGPARDAGEADEPRGIR